MFNHQISLKFDELRRSGNKKDSDRQARFVEASAAIMQPVTEALHPLHSPKIWDDISPQFLTTFW